jgi:hypothetical protein
VSHLERIATRLRELAELLADPELDAARADQLAKEAGELAAEAGTEVDRRVAEAAAGERPSASSDG